MSDDLAADERDWAAAKRDFVADQRDDLAAERETAADAREASADHRDQLADEREADLDGRETHLVALAEELGLIPEGGRVENDPGAAQRTNGAHIRAEQVEERGRGRGRREAAAAAREEATRRRRAATPTTPLAMAFADIARHLYEADHVEKDVFSRIAEAAVSSVAGCQMASVTMRDEKGRFRTVASTHAQGTQVDEAQYEVGEGPCLDAVEEPIVYAPAFPDQRWPLLGSRPADSGVQAVVAYRLAPSGSVADDSVVGSLNVYAGIDHAFDEEAQEIGFILAAHASVAARVVRDRQASADLSRDFQQALSSRDVIGQAKGILMERLKITPEDAFDTLRRSSQRLNLKLREIAESLAQTGEFDDNVVKGR